MLLSQLSDDITDMCSIDISRLLPWGCNAGSRGSASPTTGGAPQALSAPFGPVPDGANSFLLLRPFPIGLYRSRVRTFLGRATPDRAKARPTGGAPRPLSAYLKKQGNFRRILLP